MKTLSGKLGDLFRVPEVLSMNLKIYFGDPEFLAVSDGCYIPSPPRILRNPSLHKIRTKYIFLFNFIFNFSRAGCLIGSKVGSPIKAKLRKKMARDLFLLNWAIVRHY